MITTTVVWCPTLDSLVSGYGKNVIALIRMLNCILMNRVFGTCILSSLAVLISDASGILLLRKIKNRRTDEGWGYSNKDVCVCVCVCVRTCFSIPVGIST